MKDAPVKDARTGGVIDEAGRIIRRGGLVVFPTETVYGLGADACNSSAVAKIFDAKRRPSFDPLIVHIADEESASRYGDLSAENARKLTRRFWPGPLTLVVRKSDLVPSIVTAGLETVALRVPSHPVALALIRAAGCAIAAPSANLFGYVSPTAASHAAEQLRNSVELILDAGPCHVGIESTILSLAGDAPLILRAGGLPREELEAIMGPLELAPSDDVRPSAPGQLTRHYATRTPLQVLHAIQPGSITIQAGERVGLLSLAPVPDKSHFDAVEVLSETGDLREAAANFFAALRRLDNLGLDRLVALPVPARGLGLAMMDRLRRCAVREP